MLIYAEDLVASFHSEGMPQPWHRWFSFEKSVSASALGLPGCGRVRICAVVLPWASPRPLASCWHRNVVLPPLSSSVGLLSAASGNRDGWSIYIGDFLDISILPRHGLLGRLGAVSASQSVVRDVYAARGIPRNLPKSTASSLAEEHVGYLFDGDQGDIGVRHARLLEVVSIGLLLLLR